MVHSQAYAENEWKSAQPWNPPTTLALAPGESRTYGLKFLLSGSIREIENTLAQNDRPVAVGVPGYVVPMDMDARLFLKYPESVASMKVEPEGALSISAEAPLSSGWRAYSVQGKTWGRSRLSVTYQDGSLQTIQYFVTKTEAQAVADMGHFLTDKQWYVDPKDPFHRGPSVMTYDREADQVVMQDSRAWFAGLGVEGGGGAWLSANMKELVEPDKKELEKLQQFCRRGSSSGRVAIQRWPASIRCAQEFSSITSLTRCHRAIIASDFDWTTWTAELEQESVRAG